MYTLSNIMHLFYTQFRYLVSEGGDFLFFTDLDEDAPTSIWRRMTRRSGFGTHVNQSVWF